MEEKQGEGFTIKDKDLSAQDEKINRAGQQTADSAGAKSASNDTKSSGQSASQLPDINFASFIISLSSSALYLLGDIPDSETNKTQRNLTLAKQTIDILGLLKEKTVGNLTREESQMLESLLYDLRMRYVDELKKDAH